MTRNDPNLDSANLSACLRDYYGVDPAEITFLPLGFDLDAAVYDVRAEDGSRYFLKLRVRRDGRAAPVSDTGQLVARALADAGFSSVVAPLPTRSSALTCRFGPRDVILYPFVDGENATVAAMSDQQWVTFGAALRAVHDSGIEERFRDELPVERFDLPSATLVRNVLATAATIDPAEGIALDHARFWLANADRIRAILDRAQHLGRELRSKRFELVLCHGDIHSTNIMIAGDGTLHLVDWDGPLIAPRERDLLFVVGSTIGRPVQPHQERRFFAGYGPVAVDPVAIVYYRYERCLQDLGEIGRSVFHDAHLDEETHRDQAAVAEGYFIPGGFLDRAETVERHDQSTR